MRKRGYKVSGRSTQKILKEAEQLRKSLIWSERKYFPIVSFLEVLAEENILNFEVCEDSEVANRGEAFYDPVEKKIIIPDSVYEAAYSGQGRARFTITHELGHFFLEHSVVFGRNDDVVWKPYIDSEWQANTFAGFFLAPPSLISLKSTAEQIAVDFGLSFEAAIIALNNAKKFRS